MTTPNDVKMPDRGTPLLSPLRYPGSKRRLAQYIQEAIELNHVEPELFVEPFAGGASVALQFLLADSGGQVGLADVDPLVASFWHCVFFDTDWLVGAIQNQKVTLKEWRRFKALTPKNCREKALKCIFLNRTSYSGILAPGAGPIGGISQTSEYDLGCRFSKETIVKRIRQASHFRDRVAFVWECDWSECLRKVGTRKKRPADDRTFLYLDPPFYKKAESLYTYYFAETDHRALHDAVVKLPYQWLLSYDAASMIEQLYTSNGARPKRVEMLYSVSGATGQHAQQELIITNLQRLPRATRLWETDAESR